MAIFAPAESLPSPATLLYWWLMRGLGRKFCIFLSSNLFSQVSVERDRRLSLGPDALKVFNKKKKNSNLNKNNKTDIMFHKGASLASTGEPCFTKRLCPCSKVVDISTQLICIWIIFISSFFLFLLPKETLPFLQRSWTPNTTFLKLDFLSGKYTTGDFPSCNLHQPMTLSHFPFCSLKSQELASWQKITFHTSRLFILTILKELFSWQLLFVVSD